MVHNSQEIQIMLLHWFKLFILVLLLLSRSIVLIFVLAPISWLTFSYTVFRSILWLIFIFTVLRLFIVSWHFIDHVQWFIIIYKLIDILTFGFLSFFWFLFIGLHTPLISILTLFKFHFSLFLIDRIEPLLFLTIFCLFLSVFTL